MRDLPRRQWRRRRRRGPQERQVQDCRHRPGSQPGHHQRRAWHRHAGVPIRHGGNSRRHRLPPEHERLRSRRRNHRAIPAAAAPSSRGAAAACAATASTTNGSRVAPNLSDIGAIRSAASLRAVAGRAQHADDADQPSRPHRHRWMARSINGRRLNEDTYTSRSSTTRSGWSSFSKVRSSRVHRSSRRRRCRAS